MVLFLGTVSDLNLSAAVVCVAEKISAEAKRIFLIVVP